LGYERKMIDENAKVLIKYNHGLVSELDMDFYYDRDIAHMKDVRSLFYSLDMFVLIALGTGTIYAIFKFRTKRDDLGVFLKLSGVSVLLVLSMGLIGTLLDFETWFIGFHEIFFDNDLWQLSYENSNLIRFFPHEFFIKFIWFVAVLSVMDALALVGLGIWADRNRIKG